MNEEKSTIDILKDFAVSSNRQISTDHEATEPGIILRYSHHKNLIVISSKIDEPIFVFYNNQKDLSTYRNYCGVFFPIQISQKTQLKLSKRDLIDNLNLFNKKDRLYTGSKGFDKKIIIQGQDEDQIIKLIQNTVFKDLLLKALSLTEGLHCVFNMPDLSILPQFQNQSHIGLIKNQSWILEEDLLEQLFQMLSLMLHANKDI